MSLHRDLLTQAYHLATREPRKPKQASLRRSASASYYAVFHLLVDAAVRRLVPGRDRVALRNCLRRSFRHATMKKVARQFAAANISDKLKPALNGLAPQEELVYVADSFAQLQESRHRADYDIGGAPFTRLEVLTLVFLAESAFLFWDTVRNSPQADAFLVGLLAFDTIQT